MNEKYRDIGMKLTPQRLAILDCLEANTSHPSAEDIYKMVREMFPTMSFATVYNTLEALKKRGEIRELTVDPDRRRYDPNTSLHHHLLCLKCKKIVDIREEFTLQVPEDERGGFRITGNHVEFYGLCGACVENVADHVSGTLGDNQVQKEVKENGCI